MSIVGTRPPLISETNLYEPRHKARLAIKPGITGMWQVSGRSDITDFEEVVRLDKEYIEKYIHEQYDGKTGMIEYMNRVLETTDAYICNSRPRRFGKSYAAKNSIGVRPHKAVPDIKRALPWSKELPEQCRMK